MMHRQLDDITSRKTCSLPSTGPDQIPPQIIGTMDKSTWLTFKWCWVWSTECLWQSITKAKPKARQRSLRLEGSAWSKNKKRLQDCWGTYRSRSITIAPTAH